MKRKRKKYDEKKPKTKDKNKGVSENFDKVFSLNVIKRQITNEAERAFFMNIKDNMTNEDIEILHEEMVLIINTTGGPEGQEQGGTNESKNPYGHVSEKPITSALRYIQKRILKRKTKELKGEVSMRIKNRTLNIGCSPETNVVLRCIQYESIDLLYFIDNTVRMFNWNYDNNLYLFFCIRECKRLDILNFLLERSKVNNHETFNLMIGICLKNKDYAKVYVIHDHFDHHGSGNIEWIRGSEYGVYPIEVLLNLKKHDKVIERYSEEDRPHTNGDDLLDKLEMVIDVLLNDGKIDEFYELVHSLEENFELSNNPIELTVTPLMRALKKKLIKCANLLIEKFKTDLTACDGKLLTLAAACGDFDLFMKFATKKIGLNMNINNNEPILEACRNDNTDIVMFLSSIPEVEFEEIAYYCLDQCLLFSSYLTTFFMLTTPELMPVLELEELRTFIFVEYKNCVGILNKEEGRSRKYPHSLKLMDTEKKENNLLRKLSKSLETEPAIKINIKNKKGLVVILLKLILLQNFEPMEWEGIVNESTLMLQMIKYKPKGSQWYLTMKNKNEMVKYILEKYVKFIKNSSF